jgi:hypothetical protein
MRRLPLWLLIGRIWVDSEGHLRYSLSFGDRSAARAAQKTLGFGSVQKGRLVVTGPRVVDALAAAGAPREVVDCAARCVEARRLGRVGFDCSFWNTELEQAVRSSKTA